MHDIIYGISFALHLLSTVVWIGGMFFAYMALRPAVVQTLEGPFRLKLWGNTLSQFFPWVNISIILLITSGLVMIYTSNIQLVAYLKIMIGLGVVMMLIFGHVYFAAFKKLKQAIIVEDWETGKSKLAQIRKLIGINLLLGLILVTIVGIAKNL